MRVRLVRLAAAVAIGGTLAVAGVPTVVGPAGSARAEADRDIRIDAAGPLGPITLIGDSVLSGAGYAPDTLPDMLAAEGWGPIRFRAGLGYSAGNLLPSSKSSFSTAQWIRTWRSEGWDPRNVVVNLGNNDAAFCGADVECQAAGIRYVLDAIGPGHVVWWSTITRIYTQAVPRDAYNAALHLVASERPDVLKLWDWYAVAPTAGVSFAWDGIHLRDLVSYRTRSRLMADDITAQLASASRTGGDAALPVAAAAASEYLPLAPERLIDTRDASGRLAAGGVLRIERPESVPVGATAVAANVTAVDPAGAGFLTAYPCTSARPLASSGNYSARVSRGAQVVTPLGTDGSLCVYSSAAADVVVDLQGAFVGEGARFTPLAPERLVDTRSAGRAEVLALAAPAGAAAVALNLTAIDAGAPGFLTAYPCGTERPEVASVNFGVHDTIGGATFVPVGADGTVCVFTFGAADVTVDLTGTFATDGAYAFTPSVPTRTFDTRDGTGGWTPILGSGQIVDVRVAPQGAAAVTGTLTIVEPLADGFLSAFGCGAPPTTASVNAPAGAIVANGATVGLAVEGRLCVRSLTTAHAVFDTTGWWS